MSPSHLRKKKTEKHPKGNHDTLSSETLFDHSIAQEEQAERYQFGPKSQSHYTQAITSYKRVIQLETSSNETQTDLKRLFDSYFNCGRLLVHYGVTFGADLKECVGCVVEGVGLGRLAVRVADRIGDRNDGVDAVFNLGSSLNTLGDILSVGVGLGGCVEGVGTAEELWEEARGLFVKAFGLQKVGFGEQVEGGQADLEVEEGSGEPEEADRMDIPVQEVFVITPAVIVDTLISLIDVLLSLLPTRFDQIHSQITQYGNELIKFGELAKSASVPVDLDIEITNCLIGAELSIIESALSNSSDSNLSLKDLDNRIKGILNRLENLGKSYRVLHHPNQHFLELINLTNNYSLLCTTYSVFLYQSNTLHSSTLEILQSLCHQTQSFHQEILQKLKGFRINPLPKLLAYQIPSMISSSLLGQSEIHLLLFYLNQRDMKRLEDSFRLAVEAFNESKGDFGLTVIGFENQNVQLQVMKSNLNQIRNDWECLTIRLDSIRQILRLKWFLISNGKDLVDEHQVREIVRMEIGPLVNKFRLGNEHFIRFLEDCLGEVGELLGAGKEQVLWRCLVGMS